MPQEYESLLTGYVFLTLAFIATLFYMRSERKQIASRQQEAARQLEFAFQPDGTAEKKRASQPSTLHR